MIWGHTRLAETLLRSQLTDVIDLPIHPVLVGTGGPATKMLARDGQALKLRLVAAKAFSKIVKLTYEPLY